MQMSVERFREIHKLIWNAALLHADDIKGGKRSVSEIKNAAVHKARDKGLLDEDEMNLILEHYSSMLCASCTSCMDCILGTCYALDSLYSRATKGDPAAIEKIRDVVDKWPYTVLSIVDLYW